MPNRIQRDTISAVPLYTQCIMTPPNGFATSPQAAIRNKLALFSLFCEFKDYFTLYSNNPPSSHSMVFYSY
jgi:hypothetical protein